MNKIYSLDSIDIDNEVECARASNQEIRTCVLCHKEFVPKGRNAWRQKKCTRVHVVDCSNCGKRIVLNSKKLPSVCEVSMGCCKKCSDTLKVENAKKSLERKYGEGITNVGQVPEIRKKVIETMTSNGIYKRVAEKNRQAWKRKSKQDIDSIVEKRKITSVQRWGVDNPSKNSSIKSRISQTNSSESVIEQYTKTCLSHYGTRRPAQTQKYMNSRKGKFYTLDGRPLDSSWELQFYNFLLSIGKSDSDIDRNVPISYEEEGQSHVTFADFRVDEVMFEVKNSAQLLKVFKDNRNLDTKIDVYRSNNVVVITDSRAKSLFDDPVKIGIVPSGRLIGVDIDLFLDDRVFPIMENRPLCFYKASVDGQPSIYESFFNNGIVWKMILNRIKYMGGFISGKEIIRALNVTRTCKQPSWFSVSLAKKLIAKYCTSNVIFDPFAGWGARAEACKQLNKAYTGIDANVEAVNWNRSHYRNISLSDAETYVYDDACSVFTCPPYADKEVYFSGMKIKSACEWMKIVMKNVPNALEYVFVCDEVEPSFVPFVVDEKTNKSHLGSNVEHVVKVPASSRNMFI